MLQRIVHPIDPSDLEDAGLVFAQFRTLEAITQGDSIYVNASGYIGRALATASGTMHAIGVAHRAIASGLIGRIVTHGAFHTSGYNASGFIGLLAYVSTGSAGGVQTTQPTASGQLVQAVGHWVDGSGVYVAIQGAYQRGQTL